MHVQYPKDAVGQTSVPAFSLGNGTIVPAVNPALALLRPLNPDVIKMGTIKFVKRNFDFENYKVISDDGEDLEPRSAKRVMDGEREVNGKVKYRGHAAASSKNIREAWVMPDLISPEGHLTRTIPLLSATGTLYNPIYPVGPNSLMPLLQIEEAERNCSGSFTFRSKMKILDRDHEQYRLRMPYEIRRMIYTHLFEGYWQPRGETRQNHQQYHEHAIQLLKTLPLVCRFLYLDITSFIHRDYFQFYFRHPSALTAYLDNLRLPRSTFARNHLNLRNLHCIIVNLSKDSTYRWDKSLFVPMVHPPWESQCGTCSPPPTQTQNQDERDDHFSLWEVESALCRSRRRRVPDTRFRELGDWTPALTRLLDEYEVAKLVVHTGRENVGRWCGLPGYLRGFVANDVDGAREWRSFEHVGGWKWKGMDTSMSTY